MATARTTSPAASNILQFVTDFPGRDGFPAASYALTVNRRSGYRILEVANQLAAGLRSDPLLAEAAGDSILLAPPGAPAGQVAAALMARAGELLAGPPEIRRIEVLATK